MAARKKTTRKKTARRVAFSIDQLEQELPQNLRDYVRGVRRGLTALEKQILEARRDRRQRWTRVLREASHELGKLEERGERAWKERATQVRRDAVALLRRLEKAIEPKTGSRKKATRKKASRKKAVRKKATTKKAARKKGVRKKGTRRKAMRKRT